MKISKRSSIPSVILRATDYNGRTFRLYTQPSVYIDGFYWDGGSRTVWTMVNLSTGAIKGMPMGSCAPPQFGGAQPQGFAIPDGWAIVADDVFCGRRSGLRIYTSSPLQLA